jgi:glycosyltransferase involved in cell wall biosynthesis
MARTRRTPVVLNLRGHFILPPDGSFMEKLRRGAYLDMFKRAALIAPVSLASRQEIHKAGDFAQKTEVVPNFVDCSSVPCFPREASARTFTAVFVGALLPAKGTATLLTIAALAPDVRFVVIGSAPSGQEHKLVDEARRRGLLPRVLFAGPKDRVATLQWMSQASVYVFPSHAEGFPVSVAEAMAAGLPVIASPVGAIPGMIDNGIGGFLIPHDQPAQYASAIKRLREEPRLALSMGAHNRAKAVREFDFPVVIQKWIRLYEEISSGQQALRVSSRGYRR